MSPEKQASVTNSVFRGKTNSPQALFLSNQVSTPPRRRSTTYRNWQLSIMWIQNLLAGIRDDKIHACCVKVTPRCQTGKRRLAFPSWLCLHTVVVLRCMSASTCAGICLHMSGCALVAAGSRPYWIAKLWAEPKTGCSGSYLLCSQNTKPLLSLLQSLRRDVDEEITSRPAPDHRQRPDPSAPQL